MRRKRNQSFEQNKISMKSTENLKTNLRNTEIERLLQICSEPIPDIQLWNNYIDILEILDKINLPENKCSDLPERVQCIEEFIDWMKLNGGKIDGVYIDTFPAYGLGLRANTDINEGEIILEIPKTLIFNICTAAAELSNLKTDIMLRNMPQIALAIALLVEKKKVSSRWKPYLNILPKRYSTILYMNKDEMMLLKGSPSFEKSLKHCRSVVRQYAYFHRLFQNDDSSISNLLKNSFTYEQYRWAVSTVMTRQNLIPDENGSEMIYSLIPMWDMCNHQEGRITTGFDLQSNYCKCFAMKEFKQNDQIFIYYGSRTNLEFFLYSGFIYSDNKSDNFQIRLGLSKSDVLYAQKADLLSKIGLPLNGEYTLYPGPNPLCNSLIGFLRIFCMDEEQVNSHINDNSLCDITDINDRFETELDKKMLNFIITRLKLLAMNNVKKMESIQITEKDMQPCKTTILQLRASEEKIIQRIISDLEKLYGAATSD